MIWLLAQYEYLECSGLGPKVRPSSIAFIARLHLFFSFWIRQKISLNIQVSRLGILHPAQMSLNKSLRFRFFIFEIPVVILSIVALWIVPYDNTRFKWNRKNRSRRRTIKFLVGECLCSWGKVKSFHCKILKSKSLSPWDPYVRVVWD